MVTISLNDNDLAYDAKYLKDTIVFFVNMLYFRSSFHCACFEGFSLVPDNKSCTGIANNSKITV